MKKVVIYGRNSIATGNPENQLIEFKNRGLLYPNQPIKESKLLKSTIYIYINLNMNI